MLKKPRNIVLWWVADYRDELIQEEIDSSIQIDQDDFRIVVEQFAGQVKAIQDKLNEQMKTSKAKSFKHYEIIRLQNAIVFDLHNEPILEVNAPYSALQGSSSIALNLLAQMAANKKKR